MMVEKKATMNTENNTSQFFPMKYILHIGWSLILFSLGRVL